MASSKSRKKNQRRPGATGSRNPQVVAAPKARLKPLFKLVEDVTSTADRLVRSHPVDPDEWLTRFDTEVLVRGINSVKAARLLMEHGHWEHAFGVVRQLFELLINMEHLARMDDRMKGALLYMRFGALQLAREHHREILYNQEAGRPIDTQRLNLLEQIIDSQFAEFKGTPKHDGTATWVPSWSRKNSKTLAELSSNKMRIRQYEHLYTSWSEQAHATPSSLLDNTARQAGSGWVDEVIESDDKKITETGIMTLMLFMELWESLPHVPPLSANHSVGWAKRMGLLLNVPEFDYLKDPQGS